MASEETSEPVSLSVPGDLAAWLRRAAEERDLDVEQYAAELLAAHRAVETGAVEDVTGVDAESETVVALEERVDGLLEEHVDDVLDDRLDDRLDDVLDDVLDDRLDDAYDDSLDGEVPAPVDSRLEEQHEAFEELLADVRNRVIQVKRETDARAPADHEHGDLEDDVAELDAATETLATDLDEHAATLAALETTVERGFENYEEVLEYLVDATDDLANRVDRLARATVATRERTSELAVAAEERERVDGLKRDAALDGVSEADCEACGRTVDVALLTAPRCPACEADVVEVEPGRGFLASATLVTGEPPALAEGDDPSRTDRSRGDDSEPPGDVESGLASDRPHPGNVDWETTGDRS